MQADFLVIGAGIAGVRAAIEAAKHGTVLVVAKDSLRESSSEYAQGGVAVALSDDDDLELHEQDTLAAGAGLCDRHAVRVLVEEGPARIADLIDWGVEFDKVGTRLALTREGAHSRNRILHSHGDSTGKEIARTLMRKASSLPNIRFQSFAATVDILIGDQEACGAVMLDQSTGEKISVRAKAVLLATGGLGRVYRETTNPDVATGDGVAMAWRAGAEIENIEFVQFHPTALHVEGAPRFLLSEALRGEGAILRNAAGERFMPRYHEFAELAPRDVVSRAIVSELERTGAPHVFLDLTSKPPQFTQERFPRIWSTCKRYGVDISRAPAPVHPAAHYAMGGVRTDLSGRTSLRRLFAAGEAACTGVHGANRLASNSLLEALVFGARAGASMGEWRNSQEARTGESEPVTFPDTTEAFVRDLTWECCGIVRDAEKLSRAVAELAFPEKHEHRTDLASFDLRNIAVVAKLIARSALAREESRGAHFRTDFPLPREEWKRSSLMVHSDSAVFASSESLES